MEAILERFALARGKSAHAAPTTRAALKLNDQLSFGIEEVNALVTLLIAIDWKSTLGVAGCIHIIRANVETLEEVCGSHPDRSEAVYTELMSAWSLAQVLSAYVRDCEDDGARHTLPDLLLHPVLDAIRGCGERALHALNAGAAA